MKRFAFKLETLLRHRRYLEEKERLELSRLAMDLRNEAERRQSLLDAEQATSRELAQKQTADIDPEDLKLFDLYRARLRSEVRDTEKRIVGIEKKLEAQKAAVTEASRNMKVLDTLKTRKKKEFNTLIDKEEQKTIDEIVITRFNQQ